MHCDELYNVVPSEKQLYEGLAELRAENEKLHQYIKQQGAGLSALEAVAEAAEDYLVSGHDHNSCSIGCCRVADLSEALKAWRGGK